MADGTKEFLKLERIEIEYQHHVTDFALLESAMQVLQRNQQIIYDLLKELSREFLNYE